MTSYSKVIHEERPPFAIVIHRSITITQMMTWGEEKAQCEADAGVREGGNQEGSHTTAVRCSPLNYPRVE